nr:hypothetical protein [Gemmatimonadaceae bacterium]
MPTPAPYDSRFFAGHADGSSRSAAVILADILPRVQARTVATAESLGATTLVGYDGDWVRPAELRSRTIDFRAVDLSKPLTIDRRYDLAMSLEVAEHLPASRAASFVADLCAASDVVLFSAAAPMQGGTAHINEAWQSTWVSHFAAHGYRALDVVRPRVWDDERVELWYRQNCLVFVNEAGAARVDAAAWLHASPRPADVIHPGYWTWKLGKYQSYVERPGWHTWLTITLRMIARGGLFRWKPSRPAYPRHD